MGVDVETVVAARDIHTRFGETVVHAGVDLELQRGEILAVIGGSGCGKSVLMRELLRLLRPTSGRVELFGQDITEMDETEISPLRRRLGVLFQHGALFSSQTLLENVTMPLIEHTDIELETAEQLAEMRIGMVGLPLDACARFPSELSGGMRKRAGLARALALDPELLFLDEPTSGLDPVGANALDELILDLARPLALSVIMITHDLASLWTVADRVIMLGEGRILANGTPDQVADTDHPAVRSFFGGARGEAARAVGAQQERR